MSRLEHDIHNRSHCDFEIHVKMTGVNRPWGKSTSLILDFPQALFTRVNIPAKGTWELRFFRGGR